MIQPATATIPETITTKEAELFKLLANSKNPAFIKCEPVYECPITSILIKPNLLENIMSLRNISIALASVVVLAAAPAFAQVGGDAGTSLTNTQTNITTGNRNNSRNDSVQRSVTGQRGSRTGDAATVISNDQLNDTAGNRNNSRNNNDQRSGTVQTPSK
jgi:hypothetical protein